MPTISRNPSGKYRVQIRKTGLPAFSKTFTSKELAINWARKIEYELDTGIYLSKEDTERITFAELATRYIKEVSPKKKGYKQEAYRLGKIISEFKDFRIHQMKSMHIASYRDGMLNKGFAPATVLNDISMISQVFEMSIKEWGIPVSYTHLTLPTTSRV